MIMNFSAFRFSIFMNLYPMKTPKIPNIAIASDAFQV